MTLVVDASVAVEYLLRTPLGLKVALTLEESALVAPELLDAEVLAVLRRAVLGKRLPEPRARAALELTIRSGDDLAALDAQPALGPYGASPADLIAAGLDLSTYLKLTFDFAASMTGESPVLRDFRVTWECDGDIE